MNIIISPWARKMRNGKPNPKDYLWWPEVVTELRKRGHKTVQVGLEGENLVGCDEVVTGSSMNALRDMIVACDGWASVDNFFPYLAAQVGKRGVAIFGRSDPLIFGQEGNINLLKDRKFLRQNQFLWWEQEEAETANIPDNVTIPLELASDVTGLFNEIMSLAAHAEGADFNETFGTIEDASSGICTKWSSFFGISRGGESLKEALLRKKMEDSCFVPPLTVVEALESLKNDAS